MPSPIDILFDRADFGCTVCNAPMKGPPCGCWVKLRCPKCKKQQTTQRHETDPEGTAIVEAPCPECDRGGDKPETLYYDVAGRWWNGHAFVRTKRAR